MWGWGREGEAAGLCPFSPRRPLVDLCLALPTISLLLSPLPLVLPPPKQLPSHTLQTPPPPSTRRTAPAPLRDTTTTSPLAITDRAVRTTRVQGRVTPRLRLSRRRGVSAVCSPSCQARTTGRRNSTAVAVILSNNTVASKATVVVTPNSIRSSTHNSNMEGTLSSRCMVADTSSSGPKGRVWAPARARCSA